MVPGRFILAAGLKSTCGTIILKNYGATGIFICGTEKGE